MKNHEYFNTIWSNRDVEFYWDGMKTGAIVGAILVSSLWVSGLLLIDKIKESKGKDKEA